MTLCDVVTTINTLLAAKFSNIKVESSDNKEDLDRPSFYVELDTNKSGQQSDRETTKKVGIRIYYFPEDEHNCEEELLEMQDKLDELFSKGFMVEVDPDKTYIDLDEDGIDFNTTDNILQALFYVNYINTSDPEAEYDYMGELDLNLE